MQEKAAESGRPIDPSPPQHAPQWLWSRHQRADDVPWSPYVKSCESVVRRQSWLSKFCCLNVPCLGLTQTECAVCILLVWLQYELLKRITTSHRHVLEDASRVGAAAHIVGYKYRIVGGLALVRQQRKEATKGLKIPLRSCRKVPCLRLTQTEGAVLILPDSLQYHLLKKITTSHRHVLEDASRGGAAAHIVGYQYRIVGGLASVRQQRKEATKGLKISLQSRR
ncbi:hypothetical protein MRX96_008531 [Rhipicephalus microplus]